MRHLLKDAWTIAIETLSWIELQKLSEHLALTKTVKQLDINNSNAVRYAYGLLIETYEDADSAADNLHKFIKDNDIVLVKGSRSMHLEKAVAKLRELFDRTSLTGSKTN